ncbi:MAG: hypothetical protein KBS57_00035 [Alistipes sp.]|nr:hypothetical protein [Candidatus Minthomonas equi]
MLAIAKVLKSYGTDGSVLISFRDGIPGDFSTERPVFLHFEGLPVPFFLTSFVPKGNVRAEVHFEDIDSLKDAEEIVGKELCVDYSPDEESADASDGELCVEELEGFKLLSEKGEAQGKIIQVDDYAGNIVLTLEDGRILPFHNDLFVDMDEDAATVTLVIPEGL